jgi:cation transport regulator ChaB
VDPRDEAPDVDVGRLTDDRQPIPDPTILTTEQLIRTVGAERDYVDGKISVLEERLNAIDRATELLNETVNRVPTETQSAVANLQAVITERFNSIDKQFAERDTRQEREARDNKVAVDAAFAAQKEAAAKQDESNQKAIDKSEEQMRETVTKLGALFESNLQALQVQLADQKGRLDRGEGASTSYAAMYIGLIAAGGLLLALGSFIYSVTK